MNGTGVNTGWLQESACVITIYCSIFATVYFLSWFMYESLGGVFAYRAMRTLRNRFVALTSFATAAAAAAGGAGAGVGGGVGHCA